MTCARRCRRSITSAFLASDGTWYRWNDSDAPEEDLEYERQYECLQYNELIDKKDRDDSFFTISGEKDEE